jgi:hypothetical protein
VGVGAGVFGGVSGRLGGLIFIPQRSRTCRLGLLGSLCGTESLEKLACCFGYCDGAASRCNQSFGRIRPLVSAHMIKQIQLIVATLLSVSLSACGGGGDLDITTSSSSSTVTPVKTIVTASCAVANNTVTVTASGCIATLGNAQQSSLCDSGSIYMLTGTGLSREQLLASGSKFTGATGLVINGVSVRCA